MFYPHLKSYPQILSINFTAPKQLQSDLVLASFSQDQHIIILNKKAITPERVYHIYTQPTRRTSLYAIWIFGLDHSPNFTTRIIRRRAPLLPELSRNQMTLLFRK